MLGGSGNGSDVVGDVDVSDVGDVVVLQLGPLGGRRRWIPEYLRYPRSPYSPQNNLQTSFPTSLSYRLSIDYPTST